MAMPGYCPTCKFFDLIPPSLHPPVGIPASDPKVWGNCRCVPPLRAGITPYTQVDTNVQWPLCSSDDWCGQYIVGVAPVLSVQPNVTGDTTHPASLTTDNGTWDTEVENYTYQWQSGGVAISGATASIYTTTGQDVGNMITCLITATNSIGSTNAISNAFGPIT